MPIAASLRRGVIALPLLLLLLGSACTVVPSGGKANLHSTLTLEDEPGGVVAFQSGQPVPAFDRQPREQVDLDGPWRFEAASVDTSRSLTDRKDSL